MEPKVLRLRDALLPLIDLNEVFKLPPRSEDQDVNILVIQLGNLIYGLIVDEVKDTQEIVVKSTGPVLKDLQVYAGATILGDGQVINIVDAGGIGEVLRGRLSGKAENEEMQSGVFASGNGNSKVRYLVFKSNDQTLQAIPLALVDRLEEFKAKDIEFSENRWLVQYRGSLLPLIGARQKDQKPLDEQPIIVFTEKNQSIGLMVNEILDIADESIEIELSHQNNGILGLAVLDGKATEILDISYYMKAAYSDWLSANPTNTKENNFEILHLDESHFFLELCRPSLQSEGFRVRSAQSMDEAKKYLDRGIHFDLIISELEFDGLSGSEIVTKVKEHSSFKDISFLALTQRTLPIELPEIIQMGFSDFSIKYDPDELIQKIKELNLQTA